MLSLGAPVKLSPFELKCTWLHYYGPFQGLATMRDKIKVLRHFRKMAPFCIVDIPIPLPCLP